MLVTAELKNYRQSPRKVRLVADVVRGQKVEKALAELGFLTKKAAPVIKKLLNSAVANAKHNFNLEKENLIVKEIKVDEGATLKRWKAGARGNAYSIKKRTSRVFISLEGLEKEKKSKTVKKVEKKEKKTEKKKIKKEVKK